MSTELRTRIAGAGGAQGPPLGGFHPSANIPGGMRAPMTAFYVTADRVQVHQMTPLYAGPTAAPVPATSAGRWAQLYAAGRA